MLVRLQSEIFTDGNFRLQLSREDIPLSKRIRGMFMVNTDKEYMGGFDYIFSSHVKGRIHYDSDMGFGMGIGLNY